MSDDLLFTEDEWNEAMPKVVAAMTKYLRPYRAAIYEHMRDEDNGDYGVGHGSGSYLRLGEKVFILTNEHVACVRKEGRVLAYQFDAQEDIRAVVGNHTEYPWPLDLAVIPVDMNAWNSTSHESKAIEVQQVSLGHAPVPGEIFTFTGFAGETVSFHFNTLIAKGICNTASEIELPQDDRFSSRFHFGIDYRPDLATNVTDDNGLPVPPGLSGSTVWNTGFVAARMAGLSWSADMATVTGVVWGWPSGHACLVATRAEFLRSFLLGAPSIIP